MGRPREAGATRRPPRPVRPDHDSRYSLVHALMRVNSRGGDVAEGANKYVTPIDWSATIGRMSSRRGSMTIGWRGGLMRLSFVKLVTLVALFGAVLIGVPEQVHADIQSEINQARTAHGQKDYDRAIAIYTRIISSGLPDTHKQAFAVYANRALAYAFSGRMQSAIKDYDKAVELGKARGHDPSVAHVLQLRGRVYYHIGDLDHAIRDFEEAIGLLTKNDDYKKDLEKTLGILRAKKNRE